VAAKLSMAFIRGQKAGTFDVGGGPNHGLKRIGFNLSKGELLYL